MIHFVDIDEENWRIPLKVSDSQKNYVAEPFKILARAYAYRNARSRAFIIHNEQNPVGMGLYYDYPDGNCYILSELFIDEHYQGIGYGKAATQLILDTLKSDGRYKKVILCYIEGNSTAKKLYEGFGFTETDRDENEIIMELIL